MARQRRGQNSGRMADGRQAGSSQRSQAAMRQRRLAEKEAVEARARGYFYSVVLALLLALFAFPTFVILLVGMAPTWVALLANNQRGADRIHCIGACNLAGVMPQLMTLWAGLHSLDHALHILGDVYAWAAMYLGAAAGVGALWLGPYLAASAHGVRITRRRRMLEQYRVRLLEEWGGDITPAGMAPGKGDRNKGDPERAKENAA